MGVKLFDGCKMGEEPSWPLAPLCCQAARCHLIKNRDGEIKSTCHGQTGNAFYYVEYAQEYISEQ